MEDPYWSWLLAGTVAHGEESTLEQFFRQELWPRGDSRWSSLFLKDCTPWVHSG